MQMIYQNFFDNDLEDNQFNLVITDPDYGSFDKKHLGGIPDMGEFWFEMVRLTTEDAGYFIFCNDYLMELLLQTYPKADLRFHKLIIWDKPMSRSWKSWSDTVRNTENLLIFLRGDFKLKFSTGVAIPKYKRSRMGGKKGLHNISGEKQKSDTSERMYPTIWRINQDQRLRPNNPANRETHPTQKPLEFSKRIKNICRENEPIRALDPFAGSGALLYYFEDSVGFEQREDFKKYKLVKHKTDKLANLLNV